jgi:diketogulonate reductase-like aldo/keto reductase
MSKLSPDSVVCLNNNVKVPILGLGTFLAKKDEAYDAVQFALRNGYKHIDTATVYKNEKDIGRALRDSGIDRKTIFITSKLSPADHGFQSARDACMRSMQDLGVDYLDLYLIHWPGAQGLPATSEQNIVKRRESWRALEALYREGKVKAIGVSNYTVTHLKTLLKNCEIVPAVNQVELHPQLQQRELIEFCKIHGITVVPYSPLGQGRLLEFDEVFHVARKNQRTPAQVLLRWALQKNFVVIPKSVKPFHILENSEIFDFELDQEDMKLFDSMDANVHYCWDSSDIP